MKRWKYILAAGILTMSLMMQPIPVMASNGTVKNESNLTLDGVEIKNGTFDADNIVAVYGDTLKNAGDNEARDMDITATVDESITEPTYSVIIPAAVSMGKVSSFKDNIIGYEVKVSAEKEHTAITVSAPEEGRLLRENAKSNKNAFLKFTNDFGTQIISPDTVQKENIAGEYSLNGNIRIAADEVKNASVGTYSGTTVFTISYKQKGTSDDKPNDGKDDSKDDNKDDSKDDETDDNKDNQQDFDVKNLADGVYSVTGTMVKTNKKNYSMSNDAINHTVKLTVKNGKYSLTLKLHGLTIGDKLGYLSQFKYFTAGYTLDQYENPKGNLTDVTVESYQKNTDGTLVSDTYGTNYPETVTFALIPEALNDGYVPLQVFVPIMESAASGTGKQSVFLKLDWLSLKATTGDDPNFDKKDDNNNNNGTLPGNNSLGNNTLGSNKLGTSSLGKGSSLKSGTSSLGTGSGLKSAASVKTGDFVQNNILWITLILLGGAALIIGIVEYRKKNKAKVH